VDGGLGRVPSVGLNPTNSGTGQQWVWNGSLLKNVAVAAGSVTETWNPSQINSNCVLSNGNLTATFGGVAQTYSAGFGTRGVTTGKFYWETTLVGTSIASTDASVGIGNTSSSTATWLGNLADTVGYYSGAIWNNNAAQLTLATYTSGAVICHALDLVNKKYWVRVGVAGNWNNDAIANQNPATNTGGFAIPAAVTAQPVVPAFNLFSNTMPDSVVGAFAQSSWAAAAPSGFGPLVVSASGPYMADHGDNTVTEIATGDAWTVRSSGNGYTVLNNRTGRYLSIASNVLAMSSTQSVWTIAAVPPPSPMAITLSPASATIADNAPAGTLLATANVTMSDGSQFAGTLTTSDTNYFAISGHNIVTARAFTSADDGAKSTVITATQLGQSFSMEFSV
jgi:hypothetical protein